MWKLSSAVRMLKNGGVLWPSFISTLCMGFSMGTISNLIVQKVCSPEGQPSINDFICNDAALVALATRITVAKSTIRSVSSSLSSVFFGSWRDISGRSAPLLYIGMVAELVAVLIYSISSSYWSSNMWIPAILESVIGGLFGFGIFQLGVNLVMSEISKPEERTVRLQMLSTSSFVAFFLASPLRGYLLTALGYKWFFMMIAALHLAAIVAIRKTVEDKKIETVEKKEMNTVSKLKTIFKPRLNGTVVWTMMVCKPLITTIFTAEHTIGLYFLQQGFQFTVREETMYVTYRLLISTIGSIAMPLLFTKILKWSDFKMGLACSMLTALTALLTAFAQTKTHLYLIASIDLLKYNLYSIPQSILSQSVSNSELGLFTGFSRTLGLFMPFGINYLYSLTFSATSKTMPGAVYLLSAAGNILTAILLGYSSYMYIPLDSDENKTTEETEKKVS